MKSRAGKGRKKSRKEGKKGGRKEPETVRREADVSTLPIFQTLLDDASVLSRIEHDYENGALRVRGRDMRERGGGSE